MDVLIVDDVVENLYLLEALLKGKGHGVVSATNGKEALERLEPGGIDLIISDILMPVMDGFELCRKVKSDPAHRHIPFIIYTATYTGPKDMEFALKIGADRFIVKPCEPDDFMEAVKGVMKSALENGPPAVPFPAQEEEVLKLYSERLVRKLEQKTAQLEDEIHKRAESEIELRRKEALLRIAGDLARLGGWRVDLSESRVVWSDQVAAIHEMPPGYSPTLEEAISFYAPEHIERISDLFNACIRHGRPYDEELQIITGKGHRVWVRTIGVAERDESGRVVGAQGAFQDITDLKKAEEALRENEERHRALIDGLPDIVMRFDREGRHLFVSDNVKDVVDIKASQFIGKTHRELGFPEALCRFWEHAIREVFDSGKPSETEFTFESKRGQATHNWRLVPERDSKKKVCSVLSISRDITAQRRAERDYRTLFREMLDGFALHEIVCNAAGEPIDYRFLAANPAFERMTGMKSDDILGRTVLEVLPGTEKHWIESYGKVALTGELATFENYSSEMGKYFEVKAFRPAPNQFACIFQDITERKRAEEAIRESERRFRELAELLPETIFEMDLDGKLTFVNQNAFEKFGYTQEDYESGLNGFDMIIEKDRTRARNNAHKAIKGKYIGISEYSALRKDGTTFPALFHSTPIQRDGKTVGLRGFIIDITMEKQLHAQLHQAQKMESIGTLAGGIAHNFNNILMGVQGRASLMMIDKDPSHPDYEHLKGIEEYVKNAVELTRDLLGFARVGKYEVKPTDLNELIKNENRLFGQTKKEIRVQEKYEKGLWAVDVDRGQIRQALLNLYVNAWQAMPGGGDLYVQTENVTLDEESLKTLEVSPGGYVKVSVTDTGIGMDEVVLEKIFDPFFSTKDKGQGSGLGLPSVYGIIKNHGGFIKVDSEKGTGSTFTVYLPASDKEALEEESRPDEHEIQYGGGTILLVDDEDMILEVGRMMLERLGYRALVAVGGREAIDIYERRKEEIDLVILDMIMPDMGGGETYDLLKKIDGDVRVLLSSGYTIDGQAKEIMDRGCKGFIQKPFAMEELSRKVKGAFDP